jgi:hypothetical protein
MNVYGLVLMVLSWSAIIVLSAFCVWKIIASSQKKGEGLQ